MSSAPPEPSDLHLEAARRLPDNVLFGTSSWVYPGWKGLVYRRYYRNEREFQRHCLGEYAAFPWFRTVGIDGTYYAPPKPEALQRYAAQLPPGFPWVSKVWQGVTVARWARHEKLGSRAGTDNPGFLDPSLFLERVLPAYLAPEVAAHTGPFVFQLQALPLRDWPEQRFLERLDAFLGALPGELQYAVELRNRALLTAGYFQVLNRHGATHCFNHWTRMPPLFEQMQRAAAAGGLRSSFYLARLLTPLGMRYAEAVERFQPYTRIQQVNERMREDALRLVRRAAQRNVRAFVLVNNRCEGSAPMTIDAIGRRVGEQRAAAGDDG